MAQSTTYSVGRRVDELHAHMESRARSLLPYLIVALAALALLAWALLR